MTAATTEGGAATETAASATYPGQLRYARHARRFIEARLRAWGVVEPTRSDLVVAANEVVTNALRHGRGPVTVELAAQDGSLHVEAHDQGGRQPAMRPAALTEPGGWGLHLLERIADAWGAEVVPGQRTTVWFDARYAA